MKGRTDEDVRDGPLLRLFLEVVLDVSAVREVVESAAHKRSA
jgi:hypothetical protein